MDDLLQFQRDFLARLDNQLYVARLFDFLPEVYFYAKNERSQFVKANQACLYMHGARREEQMIGKSDYDYHPRDLADQYVAEDQRVMLGGVPVPNQVWLVPDHRGNLKWYISSKIPLLGDGGKVIGIAGAMRDVAEAGRMLEPYRELDQVVTYVLRHFAEKIEVQRLADMMHLSVSQFDRKFKRVLQITPQQYILRVRTNAACQELTNTSKSIAQIAQQCGFYDQSYFTRQFVSQMGMTPTAYRAKYVATG